MSDYAIIEFPSIPPKGSRLILSDISGRVVRSISTLGEKSIEIYKNGLSPGLYIIELVGDRNYRGKLLIE